MSVIRCEMNTKPEWQSIELVWEINDFYKLVKLAESVNKGSQQKAPSSETNKLVSPIFQHADAGSWRMEIAVDRTVLETSHAATGGQPHLLLFRGAANDSEGTTLRLLRDFQLQIIKDVPVSKTPEVPYNGVPDKEKFGMIGAIAWKSPTDTNTVTVKCNINYLMATSSKIVTEGAAPSQAIAEDKKVAGA